MGGRTKVHTTCRWCGPITVASGDIGGEVNPRNPAEGLCEFSCPSCGRLLVVHANGDAVRALCRAGAGRICGCVPFELLEPHAGPPVTWQEVLDFHTCLSQGGWSQELPAGRSSRRAA